VLVGLAFGAGVLLIATGLRPAPVPLATALQRLHREDPLSVASDAAPSSVVARLLGQPWAGSPLARRVIGAASADLRVGGTTPADHLGQRVACAVVALLWAPATAALMLAGGVRVGFALPLWISVALVPVGFILPGIALRARATERRRSFRHAFSSFLDIVAVSLAGGQGVDGALHAAAEAGHGWAFAELRGALLEARLLGEPPWAGLARLGADIGVSELTELAASAGLAGAEGARVRASIAAKAKALRQRGLTDVEASAQSASERMSLPIVALLVFFVVFLGYPAVVQVVRGF
jgi:Flp pilus assembly protein TadB